jgi:molybdate transport system regulatory protein
MQYNEFKSKEGRATHAAPKKGVVGAVQQHGPTRWRTICCRRSSFESDWVLGQDRHSKIRCQHGAAMPTPTLRLRIDFGRDCAVGPGKIALLEHIDTSGSLSQAARDLNMSYRRAWQLLESLNRSFRERVVVTSRGGRGGGGAVLTPFGQALIGSFRRFESDMQARARRHFGVLSRAARQSRVHSKDHGAPVIRLSERR